MTRSPATLESMVASSARLRLTVQGAVQGMGFRPFVHRLATELKLTGWVRNSPRGVTVEVEGLMRSAESFLLRLETEKPPHSSIEGLEVTWLESVGHRRFEIRDSEDRGAMTALILPDIATCSDCRRELFDPANRRYRYPFTNCAGCGPRFSLMESLPYDRANTSMRRFMMCAECRTEYDDPRDRRFHAQPNACPVCGPHLEWWDADGECLKTRDEALRAASGAIRRGLIVAVKGLGGYHLMVSAHDDEAVRRLRELKHREEKPFALMFPSLESVCESCEVSPVEERVLRSPEAPITLLRRKAHSTTVAPAVAPRNPCLGAMLPYSPLHHLLLAELGLPVVATSGNRSDEPLCTHEPEALQRLAGIANFFLVHNRPIARPVDDSIVRVVAGRQLVLRRARGFAPLPVRVKAELPTTLAVGAHLKSTVALSVGRQVFLSQHIGDLGSASAMAAFGRAAADLQSLYEVQPGIIAADEHDDYLSSQYAKQCARRLTDGRMLRVQHHYAHVLSCMAENELEAPVLGVCWDGAGYGLDGTIWGGEFLRITPDGFERAAHLRAFRLPGGERAMQEPRRAALGLLCGLIGGKAFSLQGLPTLAAFSALELRTIRQMMAQGVNTPFTSSVGRLFDAVSSLLGLCQVSSFEGQAAMEIEFAADTAVTDDAYEMALEEGVLDWTPMLHGLLRDIDGQIPKSVIAAKFQQTLIEGIVAVARIVGEERVALSGGCFQSQRLTERAVGRLREEGFRPYWHQRVPPNDGGIALGQVLAVSQVLAREKLSCV